MLIKKILRRLGFWFALALFAIFAIFPAVYMLISAFKQDGDLYNVANNPFLFNLPPTLENVTFPT